MQDDNALAQLGERAHDVLDDDEREIAAAMNRADDIERFSDFGRGQSGQDFVQQEEARAGGKRAGNLQALTAGERQGLGAPVEIAPKSDFVQNLARTIFRGAARAFAGMAIHGGDHKIVDDAQAAEGAHDLEGACDA